MPPNINQSDSTHTPDPRAQIAEAPKLIIVGIDFGTSTTKVMYRPVELGGRTRLICFAHGHPKFPSYAMPSSVRLDSEYKLWFGDIAEVGYGQVFRSFKVCVACQAGAVVCRGCNQNNAEKNTTPGRFEVSLIGFIPAHELMIYYLAWLLDIINGAIAHDQQGAFKLEFQYNLGVPVSHLAAKPDLVDRFEWILHTALALRGKIQQGISAAQARSHLIEALPCSLFPSRKARLHRALPETAAAAMWLQKAADDDEDITNYMLIDIGAGTTDITIYRYSQVNPDALPIYGANSVTVAGDNVDFSTIQWFARKCGKEIGNPSQLSTVLLQKMRCVKELLPRPDQPMKAVLGEKIITLDETTYKREVVSPHAEGIYKAADKTFREAYQRAHHVRHFREMRIVLLGGGSRIVGMRQYFRDHRLRNFMEQHILEPRTPADVDMKCVTDFQLLAVAYGLAFPSAGFPGNCPPNQIQPLPPDKPDPPPAYDENALLSN